VSHLLQAEVKGLQGPLPLRAVILVLKTGVHLTSVEATGRVVVAVAAVAVPVV